MAKLDTTVDNIQLKSNMLIAGASDADWASDSKYPSAMAVFTKLSNIPCGTTVDTNQTVKTGNVTFGVDDTVEFVAGANVSISGDATAKKITISATDTNTETSLTVTDKTNSDNTDLVYAVTNLVESGTKGHTLTPTYTGLPTKTYVDKMVTGTVEYLGTVSALTGLSTTAGKGDFYRVLTAFTVGSETAHVGDILIATKDNPTQTATDWDVIHAEIDSNTWVANTATAAGYVAAPGANVANKVWKTDSTGTPGWRDDANTDTGATSVEVTGTGNVVTGATYDSSSRKLTLTKGASTSSFPVGSVLMIHKELATGETAQSTNPATTLGGEWTLIDKEFKNTSSNIASLWTSNRATASGSISWADHSICVKMWLVTDEYPLSAGNSFGSIDRTKAGVTDFTYSDEGGIALAVSGTTNTTGYVIKYKLDGGGYLSLDRLYDEDVAAISGATIHIQTIIPIAWGSMLDSACDKFYWKRTA